MTMAERLVKRGVRIALGQQAQMPGKRQQAVDGERALQQPRRVEGERLGLEHAEMLVEPGPPGQRHLVAGLQHRLLLARTAAAHQAEMAAMRARHHLEDGAGLAMLPGAEDDAFVLPFHAAFAPGKQAWSSRPVEQRIRLREWRPAWRS